MTKKEQEILAAAIENFNESFKELIKELKKLPTKDK